MTELHTDAHHVICVEDLSSFILHLAALTSSPRSEQFSLFVSTNPLLGLSLSINGLMLESNFRSADLKSWINDGLKLEGHA